MDIIARFCYTFAMNIRFTNARIMTRDLQCIDGELWTDGAKIAYVGAAKTPAPADAFDRMIDCRGGLLLPGFKNAHTHSGMTFLRSRADDMPLDRWLNEQVYPYERRLTADDIYTLTRLAMMEYVEGGITAMLDMYFQPDAIAQAGVDTGFRTVLTGAANDYGGTAAQTAAEYDRYNALHPLVSYVGGFHAEYTSSEALVDSLAEMAKAKKIPMFTHLAETKKEVESCYARYGVSPVRMLCQKGMFDYGGGGYHLVHVDAADRALMQEYGLYAVTCPGSNTKLASGVAPVYEYYGAGIPVAIGTDGPASNNCLDFFREMFLVTGLQKLRYGADAVDALRVLDSACRVGALAMGLPQCAALEAGLQADVTLLSLDAPNMRPVNHALKNVVYSGNKKNVRMTVIAGRIVYEDGRFATVADPEKVYADAQAIVSRMNRNS